MKVCFETFGCRLNKSEALQQEAEYLAKGWQLTQKHVEADLFIVRGCSVTARAQYDCERLIEHLKRHYPTKPVIVTGCLDKAKGSAENKLRILKSPPRVKPAAASAESAAVLPTRTARAYLKVQDGCSGKCTFCIVPKFRGKSVSLDFDGLKERARAFIDAGYHEIVVTGCNLALYASQGKRLPELLAALCELSDDCRIRLGSIEPGEVAAECLTVMSEHANFCRYLHLPIQSGSNRILEAMGRPYHIREVEELVQSATAKFPNLGLGADLMTGFPGESELDFIATESLLKRYPFSNLHVFPYSERPGTLAVALSNVVAKSVRRERSRRLAQQAEAKHKAFAQKFVGKVVEVVVESDTKVSGWTGEYLPCEGIGTAARKALVRIAVTQYRHGKLRGRLLA